MAIGFRAVAVRAFAGLALLALAAGGAGEAARAAEPLPIRGCDVTEWDRHQIRGTVFRDALGEPVSFFSFLREQGVNTARFRLLVSPRTGFGTTGRAVLAAQVAAAEGFEIYLDLHLSDGPAGVLRQTKPAAWSQLSPVALAQQTRRYVRETLESFVRIGVRPAFVQLGHEIDHGLLWDDGRFGDGFDSPEQRERLGLLLRSAVEGVRDVLRDEAQVVLHVANSHRPDDCLRFFEALDAEGVDFDTIGLSFYPWWQGTFEELQTTIRRLHARFACPVLVAETAYPWILRDFDPALNEVGHLGQLYPGFRSSPEGQRAFLAALRARLADTPGAVGFVWASPGEVSRKGITSTRENLALFDDEGRALPAWSSFAPRP